MEEARAEQVYGVIRDIGTKWFDFTYAKKIEIEQKKAFFMNDYLPNKLKLLNDYLIKYNYQWFSGNQIGYVDFRGYDLLDQCLVCALCALCLFLLLLLFFFSTVDT